MSEKEDKDFSKENRKRMLVSLAILQGAEVENRPESYSLLTPVQKENAMKAYVERGLADKVEIHDRIAERDIQIEVAEKGVADRVQYYRIVGTLDDRTCPDCAQWQGKIVSMGYNPYGLPKVQDFINDHGFHPNCRCSLQELQVDEIPIKEINPRYEARKAARPDIFNETPAATLTFN